MAGRWLGQSLCDKTQENDLFLELERLVTSDRARLKEALGMFDFQRSGMLEGRDSAAFIRELLPDVMQAEVLYFQVRARFKSTASL